MHFLTLDGVILCQVSTYETRVVLCGTLWKFHTVCNKPCGLAGCDSNGVEFSFPDEAAWEGVPPLEHAVKNRRSRPGWLQLHCGCGAAGNFCTIPSEQLLTAPALPARSRRASSAQATQSYTRLQHRVHFARVFS
jgi:hypothetical protein